MKNIIKQKPTEKLVGRMAESVKYVADRDIKNKTILDIGCGYGWCEVEFVKKGARKIIGTEIADADLVTARRYVKAKNVQFIVSGALRIPYKNASMDTVVSWEVLEHIPHHTELQMFQEVARVLREGGRFYLSTPYRSFAATVLDPAWWLIGHRHYTKQQLQEYAENAGFLLEDISVKGGFWSIMGCLNMYVSKWIFRRHVFFKSFFQRKEVEEYQRRNGYSDIFITCRKK